MRQTFCGYVEIRKSSFRKARLTLINLSKYRTCASSLPTASWPSPAATWASLAPPPWPHTRWRSCARGSASPTAWWRCWVGWPGPARPRRLGPGRSTSSRCGPSDCKPIKKLIESRRLLAFHGSLLAFHGSLLACHGSLLPCHGSLPAFHGSLLALHGSFQRRRNASLTFHIQSATDLRLLQRTC